MEPERGEPAKEPDPEVTKELFILDVIINTPRRSPNEAGGQGQVAAGSWGGGD